MIELSKDPTSPFLTNPNGPHFTLTNLGHLFEDENGEDAFELPLQKMVEYLLENPFDKDRIEAIALISNNNGMALMHHLLGSGETSVDRLFSSNGPLIHKGNKIDFNLERLAIVLARNPYPEVKKHIINFITQIGLKPNLERIQQEFCVNCGKK